MTVNGSPINLSGSSGSPIIVSTGSGGGLQGSLRLSVFATITSVGQIADSYRDMISITVTSSE